MYLPQQSAKAASAPLRLMAAGAPPQGHSLGNATLKAEAEADVDAKEALYRQIDSLDKDILADEERILLEILPKAFAVLRETARRLAQGPLRVPAQDWDRALAGRLDAVTLDGDTAVWNNRWLAAGNEITWNKIGRAHV